MPDHFGYPSNLIIHLNACIYLESYKHEFLSNINIPIDQSVEEKLCNLHIYDLSQSESSFEVSRKSQQAILNVDLYLMVEECLKVNYSVGN